MNVIDKVAVFVSYAFSAPLYAIYCFLLFYRLSPLPPHLSLPLAFLFLALLPTVYVIVESSRGRVDVFVDDVRLRPRFFLPAIASYALGYLVFLMLGDSLTSIYMLCYLAVATALLFTSLKWKVSVHAAGVAGPTTFLSYYLGTSYAPLYLVLAFISWSRYRLKAHTLGQILAGAILGAGITYVICSLSARPT